MGYAYIERDYKRDESGQIIQTCQWVGKSRVAMVSIRDAIEMEDGELVLKKEFIIGNLRLRVVDTEHGSLIVTRDIWLAPVYKITHRFAKSLELIYHCFIYILHIWNLATHHPAEIPTWRNIKALNWLAERLKR